MERPVYLPQFLNAEIDGKPVVFVGHLNATYLARLRMAADGYNHKKGGLNKKWVGAVMKWAERRGLVSYRSVWTGKNCPVLRSSLQLRRSLKRRIDRICDELRN